MRTRNLIVIMAASIILIGQVFAGISFARGPIKGEVGSGPIMGQGGNLGQKPAAVDDSQKSDKPIENCDQRPPAPIDILSGEEVAVSGTITELMEKPGRDELKINTGSEIIAVCGIGPAEYWDSLKVTRPVVGDKITVDGYKVTLPDNSQRIFAAKITIGENQIQLIDPATGKPLWKPKGDKPGHEPKNILSGEAVTISGIVTEIENRDGIKINTGSEVVTVCGIGPTEYWNSLKVTRPVVGDKITVDGYKVTLPDNSQRIFAAKITIGENQIQLIDATTGKPLWKPPMPLFLMVNP